MNAGSLRAALVVALSILPAPLGGQERPPVIDMHMHGHTDLPGVAAGSPALCRPEPCSGTGEATRSPDETLRRTLEVMDRYNIVKGFLSDEPEMVRRWMSAAPDRFIGSPFILQPGQPSPETLQSDYAAGEFAGMGEIAAQLLGFAPNDPALEPYFQLAEAQDVPVLIHMAGIGPYLPSFRAEAGKPLLLEEVLIRHPNLRIFVENAGYPYLDDMIAMMYQYPQLYADVSTITWVIPRSAFYRYLEALVRAGLGKRLMYGSDQMRWPEMIAVGIEAIEEADFLSRGQKRDILYNNAVRFLRLDAAAFSRDGDR